MNETYVECLVNHKKSAVADIVKYALIAVTVVFILSAFLITPAFLLIGIVFGVVSYFIIPVFDYEYEYLYLDKEISIDKVIAKQKRKRVIEIDLNKAEIIAPSGSHSLDSYRNRQHIVKDFTSGMEGAKVFTIAYADNNQFVLANIEPNEEMIKAVKMVFPRKVMEY